MELGRNFYRISVGVGDNGFQAVSMTMELDFIQNLKNRTETPFPDITSGVVFFESGSE